MKLKRFRRSAATGRIVTADEARRNPETTTTETVGPAFTSEHLNALGALSACANKHGLRETIRRLQD